MRVSEHALGGRSFQVLIFLQSEPPADADSDKWMSSEGYVGSFGVFTGGSGGEGAGEGDTVQGVVYLNDHIASASLPGKAKGSFEPEVVVPYLEKNLHWRVLQVR